jgi:hypothetical protein
MAAHLPTPSGFSISDLVFNDGFASTSLYAAIWNRFFTSDADDYYPWFSYGQKESGVGGLYEADCDVHYKLSVNNGLTLNAVQQSIVAASRVNGVTARRAFQ